MKERKGSRESGRGIEMGKRRKGRRWTGRRKERRDDRERREKSYADEKETWSWWEGERG